MGALFFLVNNGEGSLYAPVGGWEVALVALVALMAAAYASREQKRDTEQHAKDGI